MSDSPLTREELAAYPECAGHIGEIVRDSVLRDGVSCVYLRGDAVVHTSVDVVLLTEVDEEVAVRILVMLGRSDDEIAAFLDRREALDVHRPPDVSVLAESLE